MTIKNMSELEKEMDKKIKAVLDEVSKKVYKQLIKDIKNEVYGPLTRPARYIRTYDFLNAFQLEKIKGISKEFTRNIIYNWMSMTPPKKNGEASYEKYIHGNADEGIDRRKDLWWILSNGYDNMMNSEFTKYPKSSGSIDPSESVHPEYIGAMNVQDNNNGYLSLFLAHMERDFRSWAKSAARKQGLTLSK